jgi:hypothetical protein
MAQNFVFSTIPEMHFEILSPLHDVEVIAKGFAIRERKRLRKAYGTGTWRKLKGSARIKLERWYDQRG